ncbi:MAG TPA: YHS domain-containing protein [Bryobacteraceae bacterium]|jgi:YHS domain-containing protein|nr:YHS domain-containing protein [Bryobacteraceae bacterium]
MGELIRPVLELLLIIAVVLVARSVLTSILRSFARAASQSFGTAAPRTSSAAPPTAAGGDLHKDPVCGTYVAEGAALKRQSNGQTFYYCSQACYEKHSLVAH